MELSTSDLKKIQNYFASQQDVAVVYLYGSLAKGAANSRSDLDLAILFEGKVNLYHRLGQIYSDISDLQLPAEPEVREINLECPVVYLFNVISGQLIFSRDEAKRINFEVQAMSLYYDAQYFRDIKYGYLKKRLEDSTYGY